MDKGDEKEAQGWVERNEILFSYEDKDYHGDAPSQPNNRRWKSFISLLSPFLLSSFKIVTSHHLKKTQRQTVRRCRTSQSSYNCQENI